MKLILAILLLANPVLYSSDLNGLWQEALGQSGEARTQKWKTWINQAETENLLAPEAYFNLAHSLWTQDQIAPSVFNLLLAAQLRKGAFGSLSDLDLVIRIQRALLDTPTPLESLNLRAFLLINKHTKLLGVISLLWISLIILFLRFGFIPPKRGSLLLLGLALGLIITGIAVNQNEKNIKLPLILYNQNELVPIYGSAEPSDEKPVMELPSGLLVVPISENDHWIQIEKPTAGWIKKEMILPFPLAPLDSSNRREVYRSKDVDHFALFSKFHSGYLKQIEMP